MVAIRIRHKGGPGKLSTARATPLDLSRLRQLLPRLHHHTQGKAFNVPACRAWLRRLPAAGKQWRLPTVGEASQLLRDLSAAASSPDTAGPVGAWVTRGPSYVDPDGDAGVKNVHGFEQKKRADSRVIGWHESGHVYRLCASSDSKSAALFEVTRKSAYKRLGAIGSVRDLEVNVAGKKSVFKRSVVFDPRDGNQISAATPEWTLIYLHSFSNKGCDYVDFPHYFGIGGASLRVVIPSAPLLEQSCFKDWNVWKGDRLGWRRIKFSAWWDYVTDKGGAAENELNLDSLLDMRAKLHALIKVEAGRLGGDTRRILLGGASQGCCTALDAALTFPGQLGGVIGCVGHHLSSTPLDSSKRAMPIHLFHEFTDKEMKWKWVEGVVQRMLDAGLNVTSKRERDPAGCGHWIQEIEGEWIRDALRKIILAK